MIIWLFRPHHKCIQFRFISLVRTRWPTIVQPHHRFQDDDDITTLVILLPPPPLPFPYLYQHDQPTASIKAHDDVHSAWFLSHGVITTSNGCTCVAAAAAVKKHFSRHHLITDEEHADTLTVNWVRLWRRQFSNDCYELFWRGVVVAGGSVGADMCTYVCMSRVWWRRRQR